MKFFREVKVIIWKDLKAELRTKEIFTSMFIFALLSIIIFNFAFDLIKIRVADIVQGIIWVTFIFSGILGLNRSFLAEKENDCIHGLLISPLDGSSFFLGKMISNLIFMSIMEGFIFLLSIVFFNLDVTNNIIPLIFVFFLGTVGFTSVGTLFSAMSINTKTREIMLPILLFPIITPVIISAVKLTGLLIAGKTLSDGIDWLRLLIVFDIIFTTISMLIFEYVIEE